ncbi:mechanosensitive ion channel family protein [bacterium]|nr:mechanosensitive ion channel family protein [bacterium]
MDKKETTILEQLQSITTEQWLMALAALAAGWILKKIAIIVIKRLMKLAEKSESDFDDILLHAVRKPIGWMCFLLGLWAALTVLPLPTEPVDLDRFAFAFMKSATIFIGFWLVVRLVSGFIKSAEDKTRESNPQLAGVLPLGRKTLVVVMWILATLIALQNLGYSVASLLAGIGIGGAALAFAAKDTLANFFGSLVIFVDKPFAIGDWVKVGAIEGTVEEVSLRVTRVRTFERSLITIPNQDLTTKPIENFTRMEKRRVRFEIGVTYDTPVEKIESGIARIRELIAADSEFHTEGTAVYFTKFESSSLIILVQCFTVSTEYAMYMQARHRLLIAIKREFEALGINFAYPTQTMIIASAPSQGSHEFPSTN